MTWELVDIHAGVDADQREFIPRYALWDTVCSRFVSDASGEQGWDSADEIDGQAVRARARRLFPLGLD